MDDPSKLENSGNHPFRLPRPSSRLPHLFPSLSLWFRLPGFLSWIGVSLGIALAYSLSFNFCTHVNHLLPAPLWIIVIIIFAALGIFLRPPVRRIIFFFLFAIILCISRRAHQVELCNALETWAGDGLPHLIVGKVTSPPMPYYEDYRFLLRIDSLPGASYPALRGLTLNCTAHNKPPQFGQVMTFGVFSPPRIRRNPFEYDEFTAMMAQGVFGKITSGSCEVLASGRSPVETVSAGFRRLTLAALDKVDDYDNRAILTASILDNTEYLSPYIKTIFQESGIYHVIAIDGLHIVILTAALYFFLGLFRLNRTVMGVIVIAVLWAYPLFIGMIPSLIRATIMATAVIAALVFEKKRYGLQALGLAGTALLTISPECLFSPGYQLSFAATFGLITLMPICNRYTPRPRNRIFRRAASFLGSSLSISLICFLTTAPILLYHFGVISYFGILANIAAVAAMTGSLWAFFAGLLFQALVPFAAVIPLWVSERCMDVVVQVGKIGGHFGWSQAHYPALPLELLLFYIAACVGAAAIRAERLKVYLVAVVCLALVFVPADLLIRRSARETEVVRFGLPRGGLLGIRWPTGRVSVVSTGPAGALSRALAMQVAPWIRHSCGNRLDCAFLRERGTDTLDTRTVEAPLPDTVVYLPDHEYGYPACADPEDAALSSESSFHAVYAPGIGCTCSVRSGPSAVEVKITVPGFDTVFTLPAELSFRKHPGREADPDRPEMPTALVLRCSGGESRIIAVVPPDHPFR